MTTETAAIPGSRMHREILKAASPVHLEPHQSVKLGSRLYRQIVGTRIKPGSRAYREMFARARGYVDRERPDEAPPVPANEPPAPNQNPAEAPVPEPVDAAPARPWYGETHEQMNARAGEPKPAGWAQMNARQKRAWFDTHPAS